MGHGPPVGHRRILQWATEQFGLKKSYLHDELFIPWHCQKACRKLRWMASWHVFLFLFGDHPFSTEKTFEFWWRPFFYLEIVCFRMEKPFQSNSRLMILRNSAFAEVALRFKVLFWNIAKVALWTKVYKICCALIALRFQFLFRLLAQF